MKANWRDVFRKLQSNMNVTDEKNSCSSYSVIEVFGNAFRNPASSIPLLEFWVELTNNEQNKQLKLNKIRFDTGLVASFLESNVSSNWSIPKTKLIHKYCLLSQPNRMLSTSDLQLTVDNLHSRTHIATASVNPFINIVLQFELQKLLNWLGFRIWEFAHLWRLLRYLRVQL